MLKIQVIHEKTQRFGGLNFIRESEDYKKLLELCDKELGVRCTSGGGYSYSQVFDAFFQSILAGGTCIEDVNLLRDELSQAPYQKAPSADTVLNTFKRLAKGYEHVVCEESRKSCRFNRHEKLNSLPVKSCLNLGLIKKGEKCDFDYDNVIIAAEKQDLNGCPLKGIPLPKIYGL